MFQIFVWSTYLIHVVPHGIAWTMLKRLIFKVEFHLVFAIFSFDNIKVNFDSSFWNRFINFGLTKFDLVTIYSKLVGKNYCNSRNLDNFRNFSYEKRWFCWDVQICGCFMIVREYLPEDVSDLIEVEYLVDINLAPLVNNFLHDILSGLLVHFLISIDFI